jgi:hypothetical protein
MRLAVPAAGRSEPALLDFPGPPPATRPGSSAHRRGPVGTACVGQTGIPACTCWRPVASQADREIPVVRDHCSACGSDRSLPIAGRDQLRPGLSLPLPGLQATTTQKPLPNLRRLMVHGPAELTRALPGHLKEPNASRCTSSARDLRLRLSPDASDPEFACLKLASK